MISNYVFWPTLLVPGWEVSSERIARIVDEAVRDRSRYAAETTDIQPATALWFRSAASRALTATPP